MSSYSSLGDVGTGTRERSDLGATAEGVVSGALRAKVSSIDAPMARTCRSRCGNGKRPATVTNYRPQWGVGRWLVSLGDAGCGCQT